MGEKESALINTCNSAGLRPAMLDLPYPPTQVREKNKAYAALLSVDYCGSVSELSAIAQYINDQNRMSCEHCSQANTILQIAIAEMIHLRKLGELIYLLGGTVEFVAKYQNGRQKAWTAEYLAPQDNIRQMLAQAIDSEKDAISQYKIHISRICDDYVNAVLERIIKDEEYHIMLLQTLQAVKNCY